MAKQGKVHVVVPDTQQKPGVPNAHLAWAGQFIADEYAGSDLTVVHLGDHWDMPSLSSYDRGKKAMEGRRYKRDIEAGNVAFDLFNEPFAHVEARRVFLMGNHEYRIVRAAEDSAQLDGLVTLDDLAVNHWDGWEVHDFLEVVTIDGIAYSHYFTNPQTGKPLGGQSMDTRLKSVGYSFTMGHQQGLKVGIRDLTNGRRQRALVAGSFYVHDEDYLGPQGNHVWRGLLVCHQVERGDYDLMEVSLDYLARRYAGKRASAIRWRH